MNATLHYTTTKNPDFGGWRFFVEAGRLFDVLDYAEAYGIDCNEIDHASVHAVQDATGHLNPGEWLEVTHETE